MGGILPPHSTTTTHLIKTPRQDRQKNVVLAVVRDGCLTPRGLHLAMKSGAVNVSEEYRQAITTKLAPAAKEMAIGNKYTKVYNVDGKIFGGCWNDQASDCKTSSYKNGDTSSNKIPGTNKVELNAFDAKYITVRLVYSIPK